MGVGDEKGGSSSSSSASAAVAAEADRYIGSLISLTSTSGFRYEGFLHMLDAEKRNIALQNVRSFGTEGRKKDGREIPASDKVYEFVLFPRTHIKDLEVKSSPAQPENVPEVISEQPQHTEPVGNSVVSEAPITDLAVGTISVSSPGSEPSSLGGTTPWISQSATASCSWDSASPDLCATDTISALHSQELYRSSSSHLTQLFTQPVYPLHPFPAQTFEVGHQRITAPLLPIPADVPDVISNGRSAVTLASLGLYTSTSNPGITSTLNAVKPNSLSCPSSAVLSLPLSTKTHPFPFDSKRAMHKNPIKVPQVKSTQVQAQVIPPFSGRTTEMVTTAPLLSQTMTSGTSDASNIRAHQSQSAVKHASTVLQSSGKCLAVPVHRSEKGKKETEFSKVTSRVPENLLTSQHPKHQLLSSQPLLPLPNPAAKYKPVVQALYPVCQVMEDFDFTTMNQLFNKEEIWGELGKGASKEKYGNTGNQYLKVKDAENHVSSELSNKYHAYVKDEFFDALSCNIGEDKVERLKFSARRKLDIETFGSHASRFNGGRRGKHDGMYWNGDHSGRGGGRSKFKYRPGLWLQGT